MSGLFLNNSAIWCLLLLEIHVVRVDRLKSKYSNCPIIIGEANIQIIGDSIQNHCKPLKIHIFSFNST